MRPFPWSSWRAARFAVVDVESTGLDFERDEVISFAVLPVEGGRVITAAAVRGLVKPRRAPRADSIEIHGLRAEDLAAAQPAPGALIPLADAFRGRIPVAHSAWVERALLAPQLRALRRRPPRRFVDTQLLWRMLSIERGTGDPGPATLAKVAAGLGLPVHRPHEADGDALTTAQAFIALATHLEDHGRASVHALTSAEQHVRAFGVWNQ